MESSGRFEQLFFRILKEDMTSGAGGSFGDGPSTHAVYSPPDTIDSGDTYAPGDARVPKVLGKGKVQTRKGATGGKKKKKKKDVSYLPGEENEEVPEEVPEEELEDGSE